MGKSWWTMTIADIQNGKESVFSGDVKSCIMDTGTSLIAVPAKEFKALSQAWMKDYSEVMCSSELCYTVGSCNLVIPKMKALRFRFE